MTIEGDIIAWALQRPAWQQEVLVALANGRTFSDEEVDELVDAVLEGEKSAPSEEAKSIAPKPSAVESVSLRAIQGVVGVNALVGGQSLAFGADGLTIIYGDNGSGKSGYARLIKALVGARHASDVLPNAYSDKEEAPSAVLRYTVGNEHLEHQFPTAPNPELRRMHFYDEHCGDEYLTRESTISYRPSALTLLDGLIAVCDRIRANVAGRITNLESRALKLGLPHGTSASAFVSRLSSYTTDQQILDATKVIPNAVDRLASLFQKEAQLNASNPAKERTRLEDVASGAIEIKRTVDKILAQLTPARISDIASMHAKSVDARAAATLAASKTFEDEPLHGVGSETWRLLWQAARNYSVAEAYLDQTYPVTDGEAHCVLCQQPLDETSRNRLRRFDEHIADTTERDAIEAESAFSAALAQLNSLEFASAQTAANISTVRTHDPSLAAEVESLLSTLSQHRAEAVDFVAGRGDAPNLLPNSDLLRKLESTAVEAQNRAANTDDEDFADSLSATVKERTELQADIKLTESRDQLVSEVLRLKEMAALRSAKTAADTNAVTQKASSLTREYATKMILDEFTRETERLQLRRVTLDDLGGRKGQLTQRPGLLGARKGVPARSVLSEGEQTALGLAGFFTEATFDRSKSAVIFDDPVTSLDHMRRDKVAHRLAQFAKDRQVVVFTHDVAFVADLSAAADSENVSVAERSVERRGSDPGMCVGWLPWKAKDFGSRIDHLRVELATLTKERPGLLQDQYEERVASWAGFLSETWERCVTTEVLNQVFNRSTSHVEMQKFRVLAQVTSADDQDLQEGYGATSKWARRHDKAVETNFVAPEPDELSGELNRIIGWQKRVKKYRG